MFWKHVVNMHMKEQLMRNIPKRDHTDGVTRCPFNECSFETVSLDQRVILNHYSIFHRMIHKIFSDMFPDHYYAQKQ